MLGMNQIVFKETGKLAWAHLEKIGVFGLLFALLGGASFLKNHGKYPLLVSFLIATVLLTGNGLLGVGVFVNRFFTFLVMGIVFLGGIGMANVAREAGVVE